MVTARLSGGPERLLDPTAVQANPANFPSHHRWHLKTQSRACRVLHTTVRIMASKPNKNTVKIIVDSLVENFSPQKVILFGSGVPGSGNTQSDIDLLIVKDTDESFFNRLADARRAVAGTHNGIPLDLLVLTPEELKERLDKGDQFFKDITEKGQLLYAA